MPKTTNKTSLADLFEEYASLPEACTGVIPQDSASLKAYNKAVRRMHTVAGRISRDYDLAGAKRLASLLEIQEHQAQFWAAQHLLEHFDVDEVIGQKALTLLEEAAKGTSITALGYQAWLNQYYAQGETTVEPTPKKPGIPGKMK